jgi:pSer/pThr/pTyr-binding forkhead associated (FHA) protein
MYLAHRYVRREVMFKISLKFQDKIVEEFTFEKTPVKIGRREDNEIIIDNMAVSGYHTQIDFEAPNFYIVSDKDSLNGTYVNEDKITSQKIHDGDVISIGKHSLEFIDLRPEEDRPQKEKKVLLAPVRPESENNQAEPESQAASGIDGNSEAGPDSESLPRPKKIHLFGSLTILAGGTPQIIELNKNLTKLGKGDEVDIKCTGLLIGKIAAIINKRPNGYYLAYSEGLKKPEVNRESVNTQKQLRDGDEITIGNTKMTFNVTEEIS